MEQLQLMTRKIKKKITKEMLVIVVAIVWIKNSRIRMKILKLINKKLINNKLINNNNNKKNYFSKKNKQIIYKRQMKMMKK